MNDRTGADSAYSWDRSFRLWDTYFALIWLATLAFVLGTGHPGWPVRVTAAALLVPLIPLFVWTGRPLLKGDPPPERQALGYLVAMTALFLSSAILVGETRLMTFALVPQCFMTLRMRWAITMVALINLAPVVGWSLLWWPSDQDVFSNGLFALVTLIFSVAVGSWVIRIIEQSQERAALIAELDVSRHQVSRLSAAHGALAERERMAREIHDTLAQGFTSLLMLVQAVEAELDHDLPQARRHLTLMDETARLNLAEARALVADGTPADLDGATLPDALFRLAARHSARLDVTGPARPLPAGPEVVALRSCQEALTNCRKHAGSPVAVAIGLDYTDDVLTLSVRDDGHGFDPGAAHDGYGLAGLRARATEVGGTVRVRSTPGGGTTVTVELPVPPPRSCS
ncbi:sensor histidine kinase [Streptomyces sp. NBC_00285]|uniref:sensor histidine kinase n=1 Tax=Streptomyces sp. NBC_00285 TaxID=2975700 RepID=UPI002E2D949D|nr:sensor histidine kinase [Streptomyces sp. NBC_00285]